MYNNRNDLHQHSAKVKTVTTAKETKKRHALKLHKCGSQKSTRDLYLNQKKAEMFTTVEYNLFYNHKKI